MVELLLGERGGVRSRELVGVDEMDLVEPGRGLAGDGGRWVLVERAEVATDGELVVESEVLLVADDNDADLGTEEGPGVRSTTEGQYPLRFATPKRRSPSAVTHRSFFSPSVNETRSTPETSTPSAGVRNLYEVAFLRKVFSALGLPSEGADRPRSAISNGSRGGVSKMGKDGLRWLYLYVGSSARVKADQQTARRGGKKGEEGCGD